MTRILVGTDGSEGGDRAVDAAAQMAKDWNAHLVIVNVIVGPELPEALFEQFTRQQRVWIEDQLAALSAEVLKKARERARALGARSIALESRNGDVAQAILDVAQDTAADMIVVGKRGSGRVAGLLLGSVSQKLVSLSSATVVVVP